MNLGHRITALRIKKHLTQDQMAEILGVKRARYNAWENGISNPDYNYLAEIAKFHGVSADSLLGLTGSGARTYDGEDETTAAPLSIREERDIATDLERMLSELDANEALAFHGEGEDEESRELLRNSLRNSLILAKQLAKKKFTPVKPPK